MAIGSATVGHTASNSVGSNTKAPMLLPSEYDQWVDRMEDFLWALDEDLWRSVSEGPCVPGLAARFAGEGADLNAITAEEKRQLNNDRRAKRELRYGLPPAIYTRVKMCKSAHEMWRKLKELYEGSEKRKKTQMTSLMTEFRLLKQEESESLEDFYTRYTVMIDNMIKHNINKTQVELNITFLQSLREE